MIRPRKSLGQHFLRDENIIRKIIDAVHPVEGDTIVEIGPGQGALTRHLATMPIRFKAIEVDPRAVAVLKEQLPAPVEIIHASVLDVQLQELGASSADRYRVVGNIPYNLTSEILFWLFDQRTLVRDATLMVQLEVAQRLAAAPRTKAYGILSVFAQFYTDCRMLFKVSRGCFHPRPDVDSAVIRLQFREQLPEVNEQLFRQVVRTTFGTRRKTLRNGLRSLGLNDTDLGGLDFDLNRRPEELTVDEFLHLTRQIVPLNAHQSTVKH